MNRNKVLYAISSALLGTHLFTAPFFLTCQGMRQTILQATTGRAVEFSYIKVLQWDIRKLSEDDMLWWGEIRENLWEHIRSVSSCITPRISFKKKRRMSELATWHQSVITPQMYFLFSPERPQDVSPTGMKRKLAEACSNTAKRNRMHRVELNRITLHEIRYWFVFQMTKALSLWMIRYLYFIPLFPFPPCPPWIEEPEWLLSLWRGNVH